MKLYLAQPAPRITQREVEKTINLMTEFIIDALVKGERVNLPGIGSFRAVKDTRRRTYNIQTGKVQNVPPRKKVKFKVSGILKETIK